MARAPGSDFVRGRLAVSTRAADVRTAEELRLGELLVPIDRHIAGGRPRSAGGLYALERVAGDEDRPRTARLLRELEPEGLVVAQAPDR